MTIIVSDDILEILRGFIGIKPLLDTSLQFKEYKKKYFYWNLNESYSFRYYSNINFYNRINSLVFDGKTQIKVSLQRNPESITDEGIKNLDNIHTLYLTCCDGITDDGLKYISENGNIHTLKLTHCRNITDAGIKYLGNLHTLHISCCYNVTNECIKHLGNLHTLILWGARNVTDEGIKHLGNLHTLDLSSTGEITDDGIKHLGNLHTLKIGWCNKITDKGIKFLGNLHTLILHYCFNITDEGLKYIENIHHLYISLNRRITDEGVIKHLSNVDTVNLLTCSSITNKSIHIHKGLKYITCI